MRVEARECLHPHGGPVGQLPVLQRPGREGPAGPASLGPCSWRWQSRDQAGKLAAVSALAPGYKKEPDRSKATVEFTVPPTCPYLPEIWGLAGRPGGRWRVRGGGGATGDLMTEMTT